MIFSTAEIPRTLYLREKCLYQGLAGVQMKGCFNAGSVRLAFRRMNIWHGMFGRIRRRNPSSAQTVETDTVDSEYFDATSV